MASYAKETEKKRKEIALKVNSSREEYKDSSSGEEDVENFNLMVRKIGKFLRKTKDIKFSKSSKTENNNNNNSYTCFKCGKQGHIKSECPIYLRKHGEKEEERDNKNTIRNVKYITLLIKPFRSILPHQHTILQLVVD